jgi:acetate kinase
MNLLIFNCGSSSQGFKVYHHVAGEKDVVIASGKGRNVATKTLADSIIDYSINGKADSKKIPLPSHRTTAGLILDLLMEAGVQIDAIGHRFVHGGTLFDRSIKIDGSVLNDLRKCLSFAPIHNPNSFSVIEVCNDKLPGIPQYAVFDTAFHAGMPVESKLYALPKELIDKFGFKKFGFHGLSYQDVSRKTSILLRRPLESLKLIMCHLGTGGSSVAAMKGGKSLDTSMGYSPLPGLVMSTRCGDIDAEIVLEMIRQGKTPDEVSHILNNQSGLIGLSGISSNLAEVIDAAEKGNKDCRVTFDVYAHRLSSYLGSFFWQLDGADAIVFTDDIGLKSWKLREKVCSRVENLGVLLDRDANRTAPVDQPTCISQTSSKVQLWVIPNDEEAMIRDEILTLIQD